MLEGVKERLLIHWYLSRNFDVGASYGIGQRHRADDLLLQLITIAYNNPDLLSYQIQMLRTHLRDGFTHTIADNSSDLECRKAICNICKEHGIAYLALPKNPFNNVNPSLSHGLALNFVFNKFVKRNMMRYFGFLDHDIFPVAPVHVKEYLDAYGIYGRKMESPAGWYLWPGLCFYKLTDGMRLDFLPCKEMDTGGANWKSFYAKADFGDARFLTNSPPDFRYSFHELGFDRLYYEYFGNWMHISNGANWRNHTLDQKRLMLDLLDSLAGGRS